MDLNITGDINYISSAMLIATIQMLTGLFIGILAVQLWGFRMGGVITVPLLAIYGLYNYATLPVFLLSVIAAYIVLTYAKSRSFIYGRSMLLLGIITGALVPLTTLVLAGYIYGITFISEIEFVGTILPGIAAYNFHQLSDEKRENDTIRRIHDAVLSLGVLAGLIILGILLLRPIAHIQANTGFPPILLSQEADVATVQNVSLPAEGYESVVPLTLGGIVIGLGFFITEFIRSRWGFRAGGIIAVPLLAIFTLQTADALVLYLILIPLTYLLIDRIEAQTGLYGRISLAIALIISTILAIMFTPLLQIEIGLIAFFSGLFAGIAVYNFRRIPRSDRFHSIVMTAGLFVFSFSFLRAFATPTADGLLQTIHIGHIMIGSLILGATLWIGYQHETIRPEIEQFDI